MSISTDPFFKAFFNTSTARVILEANFPEFMISSYNDAYAQLSHTAGRDIRGFSVWTVFSPENAGDTGGQILMQALKDALDRKTVVNTEPFRYDIPAADQSGPEENWWQLEIIPVFGETGEVTHLMLTTFNVNHTRQVEEALWRQDKTVQDLNEELAATNEELSALNEDLSASNEELRQSQNTLEALNLNLEEKVADRLQALAESETALKNLVMTVHHPLLLLRGRDWIIEIANQKLVELWNKTLDDVLGKRLMDVLPEIEDQPFPRLLKQVYDTGEGYGQQQEVLWVRTPEGIVQKYISFFYDPLHDTNGDVVGIIVEAADITNEVVAREKMEESFRIEQELNEEISAINEELSASNEELIATNEELIEVEKSLQETVNRLAQSESRIRYMVADAPVAIGLLTGPDLLLESANTKILELWGKNPSIIGLPIDVALPEIKGQPFVGLLKNVFETGEPFYGNEVKAQLEYDGHMKEVFFNFVYHPLKSDTGKTTSIMVVATDVTEQVRARQVVEASATRFRFMLDAIPQQVWTAKPSGDLDYVNQVVCNDFGQEEKQIVRSGWQGFIHPDDRDESLLKWAEALASGKEYSVEFRLLFQDGNYIWHLARALPLVENGEIKLWLGTNTNIDLQKSSSQKKDEFLSIASHELKTPLTSIKAYNQLISRSKNIDKLQGFVAKSAEHIVRLEKLISDLLDVTKINAGKLNYTMQPFNFKHMLQESVESVQHTTMTHQIILESAADVEVTGDNFRLEQVMNNFLTNAIKYSPDANRVVVNGKVEGGNIVVSVQDFGIGIAEESLDKLFDRYYRVDNTAMRFEGLGLGLFISSEILKRHHGSFWIESKEGKGSTFYFRIPLADQQASKHPIKTATSYRDDSVALVYNPEAKRIEADWLGFQDLTSVKHGCMLMLDMLRENKAEKVLNDNRNVLGTWSEASDWAGSEWLPMMEKAGLKYFAWIFSASAFSQLSAKKSIDVMQGNIVTRFFTDVKLAEEWLDSL
jgi:PAS domain S-box-containing protein